MLEFGQPHRVESLISTGLLQVGDGYRAKNDELSTTGLPFARGGNIDGGFHFDGADRFPVESLQRVGAKVSQVGDVVFTSKGTVGRFAFVRPEVERFVYSPQLCYWRSLSPRCIHPRWLYYWMHSTEFQEQFKGVAGQTDMADYVSLRDQRRFWITVPEPQVQESVANTLGALDDKIELNRRMNQTLEAMARALFKSWFVDFEPVVAKSEGRPTGLPPDLDAFFPSEFEDSPFGEIPKGWTTGSLGDVAVNPKRSVSATAIVPNEPYVGLEHIGRRCLALNSWGCGSDVASQKSRFQEGELLFGKLRPYFHKVVIAPVSGICSTDILVVDAREPSLWAFVVMACSETSTIDFVTASSGGTRMPRTSWSELARVPLVIPPRMVAAVFNQVAGPMLNSLAKSVFESQSLAALRDDLLPRLLSGEVEVCDPAELDVVTNNSRQSSKETLSL